MPIDDKKKGLVYLVGAGPGDPELLTIKAKRVIKEADVIVYDSLIAEDIMSYAKENCEIIYVGKRSANHTLPQYSINELLAQKAKDNKIVVRLKGGDPYLFGRGGEEAERLYKDEIPFEEIPGISSSFAVPAYAGIPLTHRDYASTVAIVTGHEGEHKDKSTIEWDKLIGADTIVILMGYKNLGSITEKIISSGRDRLTPCAVIQEGTTLNQKAVIGTLLDIHAAVEDKGLKSPLILIVGNVVKLRDTLNWFEKRPLRGLTVLVTRPDSQVGTLPDKLRNLGAFVINLPLIKTVNDSTNIDMSRIERAIEKIESFDYLIFTSVNGVDGFFDMFFSRGLDARALFGKKIVSIGKTTAKELKKYGIVPDIMPDEFSQDGIIKLFKEKNLDLAGKKVLFPQALKINGGLSDFLDSNGASTENLPVYETVMPEESKEKCKELFEHLIDHKHLVKGAGTPHKNIGFPDYFNLKSFIVTFTSYSTVENFATLVNGIDAGLLKAVIASGVKFACIGKKTADYALSLGIKPDIIAEDISINSMVEGITEFYIKNNKN